MIMIHSDGFRFTVGFEYMYFFSSLPKSPHVTWSKGLRHAVGTWLIDQMFSLLESLVSE